MYNSVQYCIGNDFIADYIIPLADRQVTGNNGRLSSMPVFYTFDILVISLTMVPSLRAKLSLPKSFCISK